MPSEILDSEDYDVIKHEIIDFHEKSKPELFEKLISSTNMAGKPSVYLRELQQLASKVNVGEDLVRHRFLQNLPSTISTALGSQKSLSLTDMGKLADDLMPFHARSNYVSHEPNEDRNYGETGSTGRNRNNSSRNNYSVRRNSQSSSDIPYGLRPYHPDQRPKMCRSHIFYGPRAKTCKHFCPYPDKSGCKILPNSRPNSPARQSQEN